MGFASPTSTPLIEGLPLQPAGRASVGMDMLCPLKAELTITGLLPLIAGTVAVWVLAGTVVVLVPLVQLNEDICIVTANGGVVKVAL